MTKSEVLRFLRFVALSAWPKVLSFLSAVAMIATVVGVIAACIHWPWIAVGLVAMWLIAYLGVSLEELFIVWKQRGKP